MLRRSRTLHQTWWPLWSNDVVGWMVPYSVRQRSSATSSIWLAVAGLNTAAAGRLWWRSSWFTLRLYSFCNSSLWVPCLQLFMSSTHRSSHLSSKAIGLSTNSLVQAQLQRFLLTFTSFFWYSAWSLPLHYHLIERNHVSWSLPSYSASWHFPVSLECAFIWRTLDFFLKKRYLTKTRGSGKVQEYTTFHRWYLQVLSCWAYTSSQS